MFFSLKTKIIVPIALILFATAGGIIYSTYQDVGDAMSREQVALARNVLRLVELNIKGGYSQLLSDRIDSIVRRKERLRTIASVAASGLRELAGLAEDAILTDQIARDRALEWLRHIALKEELLFAFDENGLVLVHPDPQMQGTFITDLQDMKLRHIVRVMRYDALKPEGDSAVFHWDHPSGVGNLSKKLGYFIPVSQWRWTVATETDISDIEANALKKLDNIVSILKTDFAKIRILKTGSAFLFTGKGEMLIAPRGADNRDHASSVNLLTGNRLFDDLMAAGKSGQVSLNYIDSAGETDQVMNVSVKYFKALDWYIAVTVPVAEIHLPARTLVQRQSLIIVAIFIVSLIAATVLVTRISRPLNLLAAYAKELPSRDFTVVDEEKNGIDDLPVKLKDEVGRLAESFVYMRTELKKSVMKLLEATASRERIRSELNVARNIQMGILPKTFPAFPECKQFDLFAVLEPAKEMAGDLYDFFFIDEDHLCFTLGDVSGKGIPAALFMVITRTLIKNSARQGVSPAGMMTRINTILSQDNPNTMFVTLVLGILNIHTGEVRYANGGHNPPVLVIGNGTVAYQKRISGPLVGVMEGISYRELTLRLNPGDALCLYTDGVTEAMDPEEMAFSDDRLLEEIHAVKTRSVTDVISHVLSKIRQHAATAPQSDDIALLMFRYNGDCE